MKSIHIRDVDPRVLKKLHALARLHNRSLQGELRTILADAAKRAPEGDEGEPLDIVTVRESGNSNWGRETIYDDEGR
jgi:plasmid stability protein